LDADLFSSYVFISPKKRGKYIINNQNKKAKNKKAFLPLPASSDLRGGDKKNQTISLPTLREGCPA
jgi:hypothetical protein